MQAGLFYRTLRKYCDDLLRHFIFSSVEIEGLEHIPQDGTPVMLVGNHQNGLIDPLMTVCSLTDRKVHVFTRGGVFSKGGWRSRLAEKLGLIPSYRLVKEGLDMVAHNKEIMAKAGDKLMDGNTLLIYPEGMHSERCHLGEFSSAYLRMAFEAAASQNFEKEIYIVPVGVHYDNYYGLRNRALLRFGQAVSISDWYERYKVKPRTTSHEVNDVVRAAVKSLVLDIPDEQYDLQEKLCSSRKSLFSDNTLSLSKQVASDQAMVRKIEEMSNEQRQDFMQKIEAYDSSLKDYKTTADASTSPQGIMDWVAALMLILFLPLGLICLWPSVVAWWISKLLAKKSGFRCFTNLYLIIVGSIIVIPVLSIATFIAVGIMVGWNVAIVWLLVQPSAYLFAWYYWDEISFIPKRFNYLKLSKQLKQKLTTLRSNVMIVREKLRNS